MLNLGQVKSGAKIMFRNAPHEVLEAGHHAMGRGGAKLVTKLRNLLDQTVYDYTFAGNEQLEEAGINYRAAQFLYREGDNGFFMTNDDFETLSLKLGDRSAKFLKEGEAVDLMIWQEKAIDIKMPKKVTLAITYTEPGFKGNTTGSASKPATVETGATVLVPLFLNAGDSIVVNTETGAYSERA